jgi:Rrf2 family protein
MRVTTWTEYSVIIALHLARHANGTRTVPARRIAEVEQLPPDYVEQILLRLRRAGLVESHRGARGGYRLARDPMNITMRDVMGASENRIFQVNCQVHPVNSDRCLPGAECTLRPVWYGLANRIETFLSGVSLADLLQDEASVQELVTAGATA